MQHQEPLKSLRPLCSLHVHHYRDAVLRQTELAVAPVAPSFVLTKATARGGRPLELLRAFLLYRPANNHVGLLSLLSSPSQTSHIVHPLVLSHPVSFILPGGIWSHKCNLSLSSSLIYDCFQIRTQVLRPCGKEECHSLIWVNRCNVLRLL
jgi:hypothetical protein